MKDPSNRISLNRIDDPTYRYDFVMPDSNIPSVPNSIDEVTKDSINKLPFGIGNTPSPVEILEGLIVPRHPKPAPDGSYTSIAKFARKEKVILGFRVHTAYGADIIFNHTLHHEIVLCFQPILACQPCYEPAFRSGGNIPSRICPRDSRVGPNQLLVHRSDGISRRIHPVSQSVFDFA